MRGSRKWAKRQDGSEGLIVFFQSIHSIEVSPFSRLKGIFCMCFVCLWANRRLERLYFWTGMLLSLPLSSLLDLLGFKKRESSLELHWEVLLGSMVGWLKDIDISHVNPNTDCLFGRIDCMMTIFVPEMARM